MHVPRTRERVESEKAEGVWQACEPWSLSKGRRAVAEGGGAGSLLRTLNKREVAASLSPPGAEYLLSESRLCSIQLNHSSKYGFREVAEWSLHRDPRGRLPSSLWCVQWEDPLVASRSLGVKAPAFGTLSRSSPGGPEHHRMVAAANLDSTCYIPVASHPSAVTDRTLGTLPNVCL